MHKTKIAINGFGRIGRKVARLVLENPESPVEIVGINDLTSPEMFGLLFQQDSVHGAFRGVTKVDGNTLKIESHGKHYSIPIYAEKDPTQLPWAKLQAEIVHECTGRFTEKAKAEAHLKAGAKRVIISAPSSDADATLCMGVNHTKYDPKTHIVVSNASCTTNCLAPVVKVLDEKFGIVRGTMLTVHSYTNDQQLLDLPHKDPRRARAAALSMIPTSTGAAKAVGLVLPHLKGKIDGLAVRVPTPNVSMVDFTGEFSKAATKEEINSALRAASEGELKGILGYTEAPLVSIDFNGSLMSSTIDASITQVQGGTLAKVIAWYDNESGFSQRMIDLTAYMSTKDRS